MAYVALIFALSLSFPVMFMVRLPSYHPSPLPTLTPPLVCMVNTHPPNPTPSLRRSLTLSFTLTLTLT